MGVENSKELDQELSIGFVSFIVGLYLNWHLIPYDGADWRGFKKHFGSVFYISLKDWRSHFPNIFAMHLGTFFICFGILGVTLILVLQPFFKSNK